MTDPRLNSMHLDLPRREDFRKARAELLQSCGEQTEQAIGMQEPIDPAQSSAGNGGELHDVASKNGTYLNGQRIEQPAPLHTGDEIRMCDRRLIFVAKSQMPSSASPSPMPTRMENS